MGERDNVGVGGGSFRNKSFDAETEQRPFDLSEDYMDCDFQGLFALK